MHLKELWLRSTMDARLCWELLAHNGTRVAQDGDTALHLAAGAGHTHVCEVPSHPRSPPRASQAPHTFATRSCQPASHAAGPRSRSSRVVLSHTDDFERSEDDLEFRAGLSSSLHPVDNIRTDGTSQKWTPRRMLPGLGITP